MRKIIKLFLALSICTIISSICVCADTTPSVSISLDYEKNEIGIVYESNVDYNTFAMFYLLKESDTFSPEHPEKYLRIGQADVIPETETIYTMKIDTEDAGDLFDGEYEGLYKIYAVCGGVDSAASKKYSDAFYIMKKSVQNTKLGLINEASKTSVANTVYTELKNEINLSEPDLPAWKSEYIYQMKTDDNDGSYKSINSVYEAWNKADILKRINEAGKDEIYDIMDTNSVALEINTKDEDFIRNKSAVCGLLVELLNRESAKSAGMIANKLSEAIAVACVNACVDTNTAESTISDLDGVFKKYKDVFKITSYMEEYGKYNAIDFARLFDGFYATDANAVNAKFNEILLLFKNEVLEDKTPQTNGGGPGGNSFDISTELETDSNKENTEQIGTTLKFRDIPETHWAYRYIETLAGMNILNGYSDGSFKGENKIKREEFTKIVVSAFGVKADEATVEFDDVDNSQWYSNYIKIAASAGIINGISENKFGTGEDISRQDMAVILDRIASFKGIDIPNDNSVEFSDDSDISEYAKKSVYKLCSAKIINGFEDGSFAPHSSLTRAQAAKVIYMLLTTR